MKVWKSKVILKNMLRLEQQLKTKELEYQKKT